MAFPFQQFDSDPRPRPGGPASLPHATLPHPTPSPKAVQQFKLLYQEHCGEALEDGAALNLATRYLQFFFFGITPFDATYNPELPQTDAPSLDSNAP